MNKTKTIVAPVGDQPEALFPALREFSVDHVHMLTQKRYQRQAKRLKKDLDKFGIKYSEAELGPNVWEDTFAKISDFANLHPHRERIVVHTGVGDRETQCASTSAAFVNGLHAVNGTKDMLMSLPVMKFTYYTLLNDRKIAVMKELEEGMRSMNDIANSLRMSLSLLSYHVHGNIKSEGLIDMGVVELEERNNQSYLSLTSMGRLLLRGSIPENKGR